MKSKIIIASILILFSLIGNTVFGASKLHIRFATEPTYPPFESVDSAGKMKGFDIDIANAVCQAIKAECTFAGQSFSSLIPSLTLGKYDALIAAIAITDARLKQVDFTQSYYEPSASYVAATAKHYSVPMLLKKTIGVQEGTTFPKYLLDKYAGKVSVKNYVSTQDAFLDLKSGRIDAVLTDTPIAKMWLQENNNQQSYSIVDQPIIDHDYFGAGFAIAVKKGNKQLLDQLNRGLTQIKNDGTYQQIAKKYFGNN